SASGTRKLTPVGHFLLCNMMVAECLLRGRPIQPLTPSRGGSMRTHGAQAQYRTSKLNVDRRMTYINSQYSLITRAATVWNIALLFIAYFPARALTSTVEDEFVGPFSSWTNVKTTFGAKGDGVTNDTVAIQNALNAIKSGMVNVLYFPAGTYKITSGLTLNTASATRTVEIIGADPATTRIKWAGATGGMMLTATAFELSKVARITWDGNSVAATGFLSGLKFGSSTNIGRVDGFF